MRRYHPPASDVISLRSCTSFAWDCLPYLYLGSCFLHHSYSWMSVQRVLEIELDRIRTRLANSSLQGAINLTSFPSYFHHHGADSPLSLPSTTARALDDIHTSRITASSSAPSAGEFPLGFRRTGLYSTKDSDSTSLGSRAPGNELDVESHQRRALTRQHKLLPLYL